MGQRRRPCQPGGDGYALVNLAASPSRVAVVALAWFTGSDSSFELAGIVENVVEIVDKVALRGIHSITTSDMIRRPIRRLSASFMTRSTLTPRASLNAC